MVQSLLFFVQKNSPCLIEHGEFIACFAAVFQQSLGAIRMPENPHEYLSFESLLAFFNSSLCCYHQKREIKL